jgi:TetR/AcrR family transcriptional regulator, cholesterol catabolism regulator
MPRRRDLAHRVELARAAFEVVRARGTQTSMRELADALGVKRPTLYFYFPDLGAVFDAVLEPLFHALTEAVRAQVGDQAHPIDRLRAAIDATLAFDRERPQLIVGLLQTWAIGGRDRPAVLERERRGVRAARDALIADLRGGIARKEVRPCDPERVVDLALVLAGGALVQHALGIGHTEHVGDELARRVLEPLRVQRRRRRGRP